MEYLGVGCLKTMLFGCLKQTSLSTQTPYKQVFIFDALAFQQESKALLQGQRLENLEICGNTV